MIYPIDRLQNAKENLEKLIDENRSCLATLLGNSSKNYMNFVRPFMDMDAHLHDFFSPISHLQGVKNSPESQEAFSGCIGILSEYATELAHNAALYEAFLEIRRNEADSLDQTALKVLNDAIFNFELEGVSLPEGQKERIKEINKRLSELEDNFSQNVLDATNAYKMMVSDESKLGDMPAGDKASAQKEAGWEFGLQAPSYIAFMTYVTDRALREEMYRAYSTRAPENTEILEEILALRHEKANILGYENFALLRNRNMAAPSVEAVLDFLRLLAAKGRNYALKDAARLNEYAANDGVADFSAWDTAYYAEKIKKQEYAYDEEALRPYFEKESVVKGLFEVLFKLFSLEFEKENATLWNEKAEYFIVKREGKRIGSLFMDLEARDDKRGGAWMDEWHSHHRDAQNREHQPEVYIVTNFPVSTPAQPSLLRHADVTTLFHEMGHALHHLMSTVNEYDLSGVNGIDWDTVEFPSQFLENFAYAGQVLDIVGRHYETGESLPRDLVDKIVRLKNFQAGMALVRQLEFGLFDMLIHLQETDAAGVQKVLDDVRRDVAVIAAPRYNIFQNGFTHIFSGGYSAGYYSYKWAEMLSADAFCAFEEAGIFNRMLANRYLSTVLAMGAGRDMADIYHAFLDREPDPEAMLRLEGMAAGE